MPESRAVPELFYGFRVMFHHLELCRWIINETTMKFLQVIMKSFHITGKAAESLREIFLCHPDLKPEISEVSEVTCKIGCSVEMGYNQRVRQILHAQVLKSLNIFRDTSKCHINLRVEEASSFFSDFKGQVCILLKIKNRYLSPSNGFRFRSLLAPKLLTNLPLMCSLIQASGFLKRLSSMSNGKADCCYRSLCSDGIHLTVRRA